MSTLGKTFKYGIVLPSCMLVALAGYNSYRFNTISPLKNDFNIKLTKRLDETLGEVKFGRAAASLSTKTWKDSAETKLIQKVNKVVKAKFKPLLDKKKEETKEVVVANPAPAISQDLDLELTGGIFNKKVLKEGVDYSGSAKVVDGVVEEINVSLPGGKSFAINTRERMVGNVFQYEDTKTRELRSGLLYEVKKGQYMITLTDDSQYGGIRLQFKAPQNSEIDGYNYNSEQSWAMNDQNDQRVDENLDENLDDERKDQELEDHYARNDDNRRDMPSDEFGYQYDEGESYDKQYEEDSYEARNYEEIKSTTSPYSHSFGV